MVLLPIVERELRVAARKRSTFWVRISAALVALVIGAGFFILMAAGAVGMGFPAVGPALFGTLTWLGLAAVLSAGLFFTSDCLSEEKREGTLGFLFLTDLRGFDIVLGKLLATSLRGFYALLGVFPILAVTVLLGGVTGAQLAKTSLALVSALILSLAAGLFVSAVSRESQKAMAAALLVLVLLAAAGPAADAGIAAVRQRAFRPVLSLSSPVYLFGTVDAWGQALFWPGLLVNGVVGLGLFSLSCLLLPRTWQEKAARTSATAESRAYRRKFGGPRRSGALRRRLMDVNPILWLACRERWQAMLVWALAILLAATITATLADGTQSAWLFVWSYLSGALTLVLYLGMASQASRLLVDARRGGLLELLLSTPLSAAQVVQGQWRALLRMFGLPVLILLATSLLGTVLVQMATWGLMNTAVAGMPAPTAAPPVAVTNTTGVTTTNTTVATPATTTVVMTTNSAGASMVVVAPNFNAPGTWVAGAAAVAGVVTVAANLVALIWFGMWMGLTSRSTHLATLKTILFVQVIPWFAAWFAVGLIVPLLLLPGILKGGSTASTQMMMWFPLLTTGFTTLLFLGKDVGFVIWSRRRLHSQFRDRAAQAVAPPRRPAEPTPPRADVPPLIATT